MRNSISNTNLTSRAAIDQKVDIKKELDKYENHKEKFMFRYIFY